MTPANRRIGDIPRAAGVLTRLACAQARRAGVPLAPLLRKVNLTPRQIADPQAPVAARDQLRLLDLLSVALRDDRLGFHIAMRADLREAGLLYYVVASSSTLLEALERATRYSKLMNEGIAQRCRVGREISLQFEYVGMSRHLDRHQAECWMAFTLKLCRQMTGRRVDPRAVRFVHRRSSVPRELTEYFGDSLEFGAELDELVLPRSVGNERLVTSDDFLNRLLVRYFEDSLAAHRPGQGTFRARVENCIVPLLPHGQANAAEVALRLGTSLRTLARRLSEEGVTFSDVLEGMRKDLAATYLQEANVPISQIAWLLGYNHVSAFSKAHRRWTGRSPRAVRSEKTARAA